MTSQSKTVSPSGWSGKTCPIHTLLPAGQFVSFHQLREVARELTHFYISIVNAFLRAYSPVAGKQTMALLWVGAQLEPWSLPAWPGEEKHRAHQHSVMWGSGP